MEELSLWGFEGQIAGNEGAILLRNPVFEVSNGTFLVVRRYPFGDPDSFLTLSSLAAAKNYGVQVAVARNLPVAPTYRVAVIGSEYAASLAALEKSLLEGWFADPSTATWVRSLTPTDFRHACEAHRDRAQQEYWAVLKESDPGLKIAWAERLLALLEVNPTFSAVDYYVAASAYKILVSGEATSDRRFVALAQASTQTDFPVLEQSARERLRSLEVQLPAKEPEQAPLHVLRSQLAATSVHATMGAASLAFLGNVRAERPNLRLDFRASDTTSPQQADVAKALLLTNLLLGRFRYSEITAELPGPDDSFAHGLRRGGLYYALARTRWRVLDVENLPLPSITSYHPSDRQLRLSIKSENDPALNHVRDVLTVADPHRRPRREIPHIYQGLVAPWLRHRYFSDAGERSASQLPESFTDTGQILIQLLENIRDHASLNQYDDDDVSLLQLALTRGSPDRVHLVVTDNGAGLSRTIRTRHPEIQSDSDALEAAVFGHLPHEPLRRRYGLPDVRGISEQYLTEGTDEGSQPRIVVACSHSDDPSAGIILDYRPPSGLEISLVRHLPLRGTSILVTLPLTKPRGVRHGHVVSKQQSLIGAS